MKILPSSIVLLATSPLWAFDGVWNNHSSGQQIWKSAGNWIDSSTGSTATTYPKSAGDTATFGDPRAYGVEQETITTGCSNYSGPGSDGLDPVLRAVRGDYHTILLHATTRPNDSGKVRRYFTFAEGNDFWGWWTTGIPWATFVLNGATLETSVLSSLSLRNKPVIANASTTARLGTAYRGGMLVKEGDGDLIVGATTGSDAIIRAESGTVTFDGCAAAAEALVARAATGSPVAGAREVFAAGDWTSPPFTLSDETVRGESTLDGQPVGASTCKASALSGYHYVSVALSADTTVAWRTQTDGETLVFTGVLSRVERQIVNTYLRTKWGARAPVDAGTVFLAATDMAIGASTGATARLGEVSLLSGTTFRKTGDGILELTRTVPATASVTVKAGGIGLANVAPDPDATKPASDPWLWLDANRKDTMTLSGTSVTEWRDCRSGRSGKATYDSTLCSQAPTLDADTSCLHGDYQAGTNTVLFPIGKSCLKLSNWLSTTPNAYSVFFAGRPVGSSSQWSTPLVGCSDETVFNRDLDNLRAENGPGIASKTGRWTTDGNPVDPQLSSPTFLTDIYKYHVVSYSDSEPFLTDAILRAGTTAAGGGNCGGMYVGEYLIYDRELTPAEKRDTEAYLLRKWKLSCVHKGAEVPRLDTVTFASGSPAVLSASAEGAIGTLSGSLGTVVKKGTGTLHVATPLTNTTSVTVEAGELRANFGFDDSLFHFDASDEDSLETETVDNGDGTVKKNVLHWSDVRRNGAYAHYRERVDPNTYVRNDYVKVPPTYCSVETADGVTRPVVHFGRMNSDQAGGMKLDKDYSNVREAILCGCTIPSSAYRPVWLFGANGGWSSQYSQWACGDWSMFRSTTPAQILDGYFALDGVACAPINANYPYPPRFACYDAGPTNSTFINALAIQIYNSPGFVNGVAGAGGWQICEEMAFSHNLTQVQRDYLAAKLAYKWKGEGTKPMWTNATALASIRVAAGATLTDTEGACLRVASLAGAGTINCGELTGVSSLTLDGASTLTVSGRIRFADEGTINVDCSGVEPFQKRPYVEAAAIENLDLTKWKAYGTGGYRVHLTVKDGTLYGFTAKTGFRIIFR